MDSRAKELISQGDYLFGKRAPMLSLWQEMADNFYPERADFTTQRYIGEDFASNLTTSYPILARRELGGLVSSMLRPAGQDWFEVGVSRPDRVDAQGRAWLEWATGLQRRAMYDDAANFIRATKQGDNDFVTFGQAVLSTRLNRNRDALLYKTWHLRDVAWCENEEGEVDTAHRKWKPTAQSLVRLFGNGPMGVDPKVREMLTKDPYAEINCRHIVLPSDAYDTGSGDGKRGKWRTPFVSIYVDIDNGHVLEEVGMNYFEYSIPRWQTVSGSQYAHSPCTVAALPDARLIQAITLVLLEAGEKAVNPPMIAKNDVVRSDINIFAGGVTWLDQSFDEKTGEGLRPLPSDYSGIPLGMEMREDIKAAIASAFYLDKINLPPVGGGDQMTAEEVRVRMQQYISNALPLFEPMENEYNASICSNTFQVLMDAGAFGSVADMPESLRGQDVRFQFESPLYQAADRQKGTVFMQAKALLAEAMALDPGAPAMLDARTALRESLEGIGVPAKWIKTEEAMAEGEAQLQQKQQAAEMMAAMQAGGQVAEQAGKAAHAMQGLE